VDPPNICFGTLFSLFFLFSKVLDFESREKDQTIKEKSENCDVRLPQVKKNLKWYKKQENTDEIKPNKNN